MKTEDLMIGDWVCYSIPNKYYTKIQEIRCTQDGEEYYIRCHRDANDTFLEQLKYEDFSVDIIHSIPLTPEILEKNEFEKVDNGETYYKYYRTKEDSCTDILLVDGEDGNWDIEIINYKKYGNKIYYKNKFTFLKVHELQHALRLCNIDKEIIL